MNNRISDDEIQKFLQGCEDFIRLGNSFSQHIREAFLELKKTYEPLAKSNYIDKPIGEMLENSLKEFETKMNSNLGGIEKICTKGSQWFAYYLGRRIEQDAAGNLHDKGEQPHSENNPSFSLDGQ
ncbi:MAG: hypothetical protein U0V70_11495 [Terriglobia bacterium]